MMLIWVSKFHCCSYCCCILQDTVYKTVCHDSSKLFLTVEGNSGIIGWKTEGVTCYTCEQFGTCPHVKHIKELKQGDYSDVSLLLFMQQKGKQRTNKGKLAHSFRRIAFFPDSKYASVIQEHPFRAHTVEEIDGKEYVFVEDPLLNCLNCDKPVDDSFSSEGVETPLFTKDAIFSAFGMPLSRVFLNLILAPPSDERGK